MKLRCIRGREDEELLIRITEEAAEFPSESTRRWWSHDDLVVLFAFPGNHDWKDEFFSVEYDEAVLIPVLSF